MIIGLAYDLRTEYVFKSGDPLDANAEFDAPSTIQVIVEALTRLGHQVVQIGNAESLLKTLDHLEVDLVFNIAEGYQGRNREAQVPILLEMKGIPFVGSDGLTQALTLDKWITKKVLQGEGIPTPRAFLLADQDAAIPSRLRFPLIVKPRFEGSSKGLTEHSVVYSTAELKIQAAWVIEAYHQPVLVEEFIRGTEFTVAIIGNDPPEVLPVVQIQIEGKLELGNLFYTHARIAEGIEYRCPAKIKRRLEEKLSDLALRTYQVVDCLDLGRVDFRVDKKGNPFVLEINPLPSLSTEDVFMSMANHLGIPYEAMIGKILKAAIQRLKLSGNRELVHQHGEAG